MQPNLQFPDHQPPGWLALFFGLITAITVVFFYLIVRKANPRKTPLLMGILFGWLALIGLLAVNGFFMAFDAVPPRLVLVVGPAIGLPLALFFASAGQRFYDAMPLQTLTYLHLIRVPVEIALHQLYIHHQIPEMMTYEGLNFDILSGLSAPIIAYFTFQRRLPIRWLLLWNIVCLGLLLNILGIAILSLPSPFNNLISISPILA